MTDRVWTCQRCGAEGVQRTRGRLRMWCSDQCRKAQYALPCVDCGAPRSNGSDSARTPRCRACGLVRSSAARKIWTRVAIIDAIQAWALEYGEPPAAPDWNPWHARNVFRDEARARRWERGDGRWPSFKVPIEEFGSWNAAITAAGFEPRPAHGGGGNQWRHRRHTEGAA